MIGYFPVPYPDELLYSICGRFHDRVRYPNKRSVVNELFGSTNAIAVVDLPSHIGHLVSTLPPGYNYTTDHFINNCTLLPYYSPFLPLERVARIRADMIGENGPSIHSRVGIMASKVALPLWLRFCSQCAEQDRERFGEAYWHRVHQVPGVEVCPIHKACLQNSNIRARDARVRYEFVPAERVLPKDPRVTKAFLHREVLLSIARDADWLLSHQDLNPGLEFFRQRYIATLIDRELATRSGRVRVRHLVKAFKERYPPDLLELLNCKIEEHINQNWLVRLLHPSNSNAQHPLHHLLLVQFLGHTVEEFFGLQLSAVEPFGTGPWPCLNPVGNHYKRPVIDECSVVYSRDTGGRPIGTFACDCGYIYRRTGPDLSPEDRFKVGTVQSFGSAWDVALSRLWDNPSVSLREIGRQLGVDPRTVTRHAFQLGLSFPRAGSRGGQWACKPSGHSPDSQEKRETALENYREDWLSVVQDNPYAGVKVLRGKSPAAYVWLYRNDREWLKTHSPHQKEPSSSSPRIDWKKRDKHLSEEVRASALRIRNASGRPKRITTTAIGKDIGKSILLQRQLNKLPLTAQALDEITESREVSAVRRIWWVAEQCRQEGVLLPEWQFVRRSGVARLVDRPVVRDAINAALQSLDPQTDARCSPYPQGIVKCEDKQ